MFSLQLSDLSDMQEQARTMPSTPAVLPSPGHNIDSSEKVRTFDKELITTNHFHCRRFVRVLWLRHAELHNLVEIRALTGECSPPDRNRSIFPSNFGRFRSKLAWLLPLNLPLLQTMNISPLLQTMNISPLLQTMNISPLLQTMNIFSETTKRTRGEDYFPLPAFCDSHTAR